MPKSSKWFFGKLLGPWKVYGLWWRQRVFIGVSSIAKGEEWTEGPDAS